MNQDKLIETYSKLIWHVASKFHNVDKNDLYQAGWKALLEAHQSYDKTKGAKFSSYAYFAIYGAMYELATSKILKVSRNILKLKKQIEKASDILTQLNGWVPSLQEISEFLGYSIDEVKMALESANPIISIDEENENERSLHETIASEEVNYDDHLLLEESINRLTPMEKEIINSRYYEDLTQTETAKKLGISQVKVSRYESRSLTKMREFIGI